MPRGRPEVTVPVLSSTRVVTLPRVSSAAPPRTTTPNRDARDNPATIATGAASSSGHGVATTNTATARCADPLASHATPATPSASGTNQAAARSASRTTGALSAAACSASAHDTRVGALRCGAGCADLHGATGIDGATADRRTATPVGGNSLAGQRRLVEGGRLGKQQPVNRNDLAGADHHPITGGQLVERNRRNPVGGAPPRGLGCAGEE